MKRGSFKTLYSLCLALNRLGIDLIHSQIKERWVDWICSHRNPIEAQKIHLCQAIVLLFFRIHEVRHWFLNNNKIYGLHNGMDFLEKHRRTCKRVALPNWAIALVIHIHILTYQEFLVKMDMNFLVRWIFHDLQDHPLTPFLLMVRNSIA